MSGEATGPRDAAPLPAAPLRVLGDERALALAGLAGEPEPDAPAVHLGPTGEPVDAVWLAGPAAEASASASASASPRLIATAGPGLWSRAPWPARDELYELAPAPDTRVLVVCADAARRDEVATKLAERGIPAAAAAELTAAALADASIVALLGEAGAATPEAPWAAAAMPAEAPAVLAARRTLIAPRCATTFGLLPGTDHLAFATADDVVQYADAIRTFPRSFEPFAVLGAIAARPHRASLVYARLAGSLADELRSARLSAAPRG